MLELNSIQVKLRPSLKGRIFEPFFKGQAAIRDQEEGTGFGLYLSHVIARDMGTDIEVEQEARQSRFGHLTKFSIVFRRVE